MGVEKTAAVTKKKPLALATKTGVKPAKRVRVSPNPDKEIKEATTDSREANIKPANPEKGASRTREKKVPADPSRSRE